MVIFIFDNIVSLKAAAIGRYWIYSRLLSQDTVWTGNVQAKDTKQNHGDTTIFKSLSQHCTISSICPPYTLILAMLSIYI